MHYCAVNVFQTHGLRLAAKNLLTKDRADNLIMIINVAESLIKTDRASELASYRVYTFERRGYLDTSTSLGGSLPLLRWRRTRQAAAGQPIL